MRENGGKFYSSPLLQMIINNDPEKKLKLESQVAQKLRAFFISLWSILRTANYVHKQQLPLQ